MRLISTVIAISLLTACSVKNPFTHGESPARPLHDSAPLTYPENLEATPDAIPRIEPKSRGGNRKAYEVFGKTYYVMDSSEGFVQRGKASWYGTKFHGNKTANGETYNMYTMTAAHKTLPIPTYVEVKNLDNGKTIVVRVNDRGPFHQGRIIDLSYAAATKLGTLKSGTSNVEIRVINPRTEKKKSPPTAPKTLIKETLPSPKALTNTSNLFIQVGAFTSLDNATKVKKHLTHTLNLPANIQPNSTQSDALFLVLTGPYNNVQAADEAKLKLQKQGYSKIIYTTK